ncbi:MAG TPA: hypothetical protein VFN86_10865 [Casimicrobiaceae bacterium]|nr:hypothetical protein [Casimicrobiaceae bacterium]
MIEPALDWLRRLNDPLRNSTQIGRWMARLPAGDVLEIQRRSLELLATFPAGGREASAAQLEALLKLDARLEPIINDLTLQYTINYQKSSTVESRLWHAVFDLVKGFIAAYNAALQAGFPHAENRRWRVTLPWALVRLAHYRGLDGKFRLFRYSHWIPAQWREFHEIYELARARSWQREQLVFGAGKFKTPSVFLEQVYLNMLLLMRLDSGNFTPDQVQWVAKQLEDWAPTLLLTPTPNDDAGFFVDVTGSQGLRRRNQPVVGGRAMYVDTSPVYTRIVERLRWLPETDEEKPAAGELPSREQRLLLMRLAALFGPDAIAHAPRASRRSADEHVRVVSGLHALTRAVAEIDRLPETARTPGVITSFDEVTQVNPGINPASIERRVRGTRWKMVDRSDSGCRLVAPSNEAPAKLGELLAIHDGDSWILGVVRRMQRQQVDEMTVGVEIIARRLVRVLLRSWAAPVEATRTQRAAHDRPFFGIYLPAAPENRQASQRSLIGPDDRFTPGGMIELDTGSARYLIRFTKTLERQTGWTWTLFNAVRKLAP